MESAISGRWLWNCYACCDKEWQKHVPLSAAKSAAMTTSLGWAPVCWKNAAFWIKKGTGCSVMFDVWANRRWWRVHGLHYLFAVFPPISSHDIPCVRLPSMNQRPTNRKVHPRVSFSTNSARKSGKFEMHKTTAQPDMHNSIFQGRQNSQNACFSNWRDLQLIQNPVISCNFQ